MDDTNIEYISSLVTPQTLRDEFPLTPYMKTTICESRKIISQILTGEDNRILCIVGPCSIHNFEEAYEYAIKLNKFRQQFSDKIFIVMRTYFEKPRTTVGWKGFINDPDLNNSFNINKGLRLARKLLYKITQLGIPCGTEILDSITCQYLADLLSWGSIGARTVESQIHRQISSGCSFPVGFKNSSNGTVLTAINAVISSNHSHCFRGISLLGNPSICKTLGNKYSHVILRGSYENGPNYSRHSIEKHITPLKQLGTKIIIDCSHGNSRKNYKNQSEVVYDICDQLIRYPDNIICGIMLESNINPGKQKLVYNKVPEYGISITDGCVDLSETEAILNKLHNSIL